MVLLTYAGSVVNGSFNPYDDDMAYRCFPQQFLDTGWLSEPFSYRRTATYGGQSYLQAMVLALSDRDRLHIVDNGIAPILLFGLLHGYRPRGTWSCRVASIAGMILLATLTHLPHNLASELTGVLFFVGLFRVFDDRGIAQTSRLARSLIVGLLAMAICTLRPTYTAASIAYVVFAYLAALVTHSQRKEWLIDGLAAAGATLVCLLPWMALNQMTVHTIMFPLLRGYVRSDFGFMGRVTWAEELRWMWMNLFTLKPIQTLGVFFIGGFVLPASRRSRSLHALLLASTAGFLLTMHMFRSHDDTDSMARYYLGFTVALALAATVKTIDEASRRRGGEAILAAALCTVGLADQFLATRGDVASLYIDRITALETIIKSRGSPVYIGPLEELFTRMQNSIPKGAGVLLMLDHSYLLDGRRNRLAQFDTPGVMGPGGFPTFEGAEAWAEYLLKHDIQYVIYQIGGSSIEYQYDIWKSRRAFVVPPSRRGGYIKLLAKFELTSLDTLEHLGKTRENIFVDGDIHVINLAVRRSPLSNLFSNQGLKNP